MDQDPDDEPANTKGLPFYARHSKEIRILLLVVVCGFIAAGVPFLINRFAFDLTEDTEASTYGSCHVSTGFKMDCLPDFSALSLLTGPAKTRCADRGCCWDNSTGQSITCFHRLPAYLYSSKLDTISTDTNSGELEVASVLDGNNITAAKFVISSDGQGHVLINIGGGNESLSNNDSLALALSHPNIQVGCPGFSGVAANPSDNCVDQEMFTIDLRPPSLSGPSYARTHFGPIMMSEDLSEISFYLPSPRVFGYGMDQFIWSGKREVSQFNFGSSSNVHLPLIVGMHSNQDWYMLWLETGYPGEQIVSMGAERRPIVSWRTMGGPLKVHLLTAKDVTSLLKMAKTINQPNVPIPPFWTLGYQMCRSVGDPRSFTNDVNGMTGGTIPFDLDCIDEQMLPTAFNLDTVSFPTLSNNFQLLKDSGKQVLLPLVVQRPSNVPNQVEDGCVLNSAANSDCFEGKFYGQSVIFPDPFKSAWMEQSYAELETQLVSLGPIAGWHLHDTWPANELTQGCDIPRFTPRGLTLDQSLCHNNWIQSVNSSFNSQHSQYSLEVSNSLHRLRSTTYQFAGVHQLGQASAGGFLGSAVPATWQGMAASLREIMMLGLAGQSQVSMPACGTTSSEDQEDVGLLCLRWFQLGSYMASLRSFYSDMDNTRMPYKLPKTYQNYITWALEKRYKLLPYLRTLQVDWTETGTPLVRPMFLHFPSSEFFGLWEQFMVGPDLVVAPILSEDQELVSIHLPQGTWYDFNSGNKYISPSNRNILKVKTKLYQIPVFQRGGTVMVLYDSTDGKQSITEVDATANFELNIGLDCNSSPRQEKSLSSCTASSSTPWHLATEHKENGPKATINVESYQTMGNISITITGDPSLIDKKLSLVYISGLSLPSTPTISLPSGTVERECVANLAEPCLSWDPELNLLMLKNLNIDLQKECSAGCDIGWTI